MLHAEQKILDAQKGAEIRDLNIVMMIMVVRDASRLIGIMLADVTQDLTEDLHVFAQISGFGKNGYVNLKK